LAFLGDNRPDQALKKFEQMLTLFLPGIPGLHYLRALALQAQGRNQEAGAALEQELAAHPTHRRAQELLSSLSKEKPQEAAAGPKISVVIPTHNRAQYLSQAIESVLSQGYDDLEIVVVDDGSTDETPTVMSQFLGDPRVRYFPKAKTGAPDTRNYGIHQARGGWLLWLDSDDMLMPGWLARLDNILNNGDGADVYYGNLVVVNPQGDPLHTIRYEDFADRPDLLLVRLLQANPLPLPGSLVRTALLKEADGFDVAFARAHDYELWSRLATRARFKHVNFLALSWRWHDGNMSSGSVTRDLSYDAEIVKRLLKRHSLKEFFPDLDWDNWPQAQARAAQEIGEIFRRYGDEESARSWLAESEALLRKCASPVEYAVHG
jgi:glycosyltransferase involved in cell wall biosynthesis